MTSPPAPRKDRTRRVALTVACIAALALGADGRADVPEEGPWPDMEGYIAALATSDSQTKRDLADSAYRYLEPLFEAHPDRDEEDVTRVVDSLRRLLRTEKDDWIMKVVLDTYVFADGDVLEPLFLDALMSPSPNLSWYGIQRFSYVEYAEALPGLRKAWRREERPWVQVDLMAALAKQGSKDEMEDFIELAQGTDSDLSVAAIEALVEIEDRRAVSPLARIVRHGPDAARLAALGALVTWPLDR
ncbi:MAG TPA: HEAT repeat domain-containing protein, partial [Candidatus Binatia bacterium]|nr:HEAT repeat domain-containing protein [Candidatus Binatia bacterium]